MSLVYNIYNRMYRPADASFFNLGLEAIRPIFVDRPEAMTISPYSVEFSVCISLQLISWCMSSHKALQP